MLNLNSVVSPLVFAAKEVSEMSLLTQKITSMYKDFIKILPKLGIALVVLGLTWLVAMGVRKLVVWLVGRSHSSESFATLLGQVASMGAWLFGVFTSVTIIFPSITPGKFIAAFGIGSVAVGFAFKDIFENFFAGFLILWRFPFSAGDFIRCGDLFGKVERINIRNTLIRQTDGQLLLVPNAKLFSDSVLIRTDLSRCRTSYTCGIGYEDDIDEAIGIMEDALKSCETVKQDQPIQVFVKDLGASSVNIELTWWTDETPLAQRKSHHEVLRKVKYALDDAGINIPFPQRVLTFADGPVPVVDGADERSGSDARNAEAPREEGQRRQEASGRSDQAMGEAAEGQQRQRRDEEQMTTIVDGSSGQSQEGAAFQDDAKSQQRDEVDQATEAGGDSYEEFVMREQAMNETIEQAPSQAGSSPALGEDEGSHSKHRGFGAQTSQSQERMVPPGQDSVRKMSRDPFSKGGLFGEES